MRIELNQTASAEQVFTALEQVGNAGTNIYVEWQREAKTRKEANVTVAKIVRAPIRYGINYANLAVVKDAIADGLREEVQPLPWGQWKAGFVNRIITHKGNEYCRFSAASFANLRRSTEWSLNGKAVDFATVRPYLLASEISNGETPLVFTVKASAITAVGAK